MSGHTIYGKWNLFIFALRKCLGVGVGAARSGESNQIQLRSPSVSVLILVDNGT